MPCVPPAGRARGFTLIEILIAMVVLMIGLVGIMSVFPAGMRQANDTVEKSYAAAIAQSVVDAIRLGLRQARVATEEVDAFLFVHDGVRDLADDRQGLLRDLDLGNPAAVQAALATLLTRDYCIVLPRPEETQTGPGGGSVPRAFLYPRAQRGDNAARRALEYHTFADPSRGTKPKVSQVYQLGEWMALPGDAALDEDVRQRWEADPYRRYGFAFIVRPTVGPDADNPDPDRRRQPVVPGLYEVTVMVYRNFLPEQESRFNDPIATFVTYVAAQ